MLDAADLPDDIAALKVMLIAAQAREAAKDFAIASKDEHIARKDERIARLEKLVAAFKQAAFGRKSEKTDPDQFDLALEDLETAMAVIHAEDEADVPAGNRISKPRVINRGSLLKHLPRVEEVIEPKSLTCGCGGCLNCIGETSQSDLIWSRRSSASSSPVAPNMRAVPALTVSFRLQPRLA
ncbi:UNVERIFIED_ORG: hypothetical protein GGE44_001009 [Rhizobium esperanzae]